MKILVCGKGPGLLEQLKHRSLKDFDIVVRVNAWGLMWGYDNRCDAWVYYPPHDLKGNEKEYDINRFIPLTNEFWIAHEFTKKLAEKQIGRKPDYILTDIQKQVLIDESGLKVPRTGILALYMAMLISDDVWSCGFDFYKGDRRYYFSDEKPIEYNQKGPHGHPRKEEEWFNKQIKKGKVKVL